MKDSVEYIHYIAAYDQTIFSLSINIKSHQIGVKFMNVMKCEEVQCRTMSYFVTNPDDFFRFLRWRCYLYWSYELVTQPVKIEKENNERNIWSNVFFQAFALRRLFIMIADVLRCKQNNKKSPMTPKHM